MSRDIVLEAKNLCLEYKTRVSIFKKFSHKALDNVNLQVERGEILGIAGKNGAGKSTLLKVLAGVLTPDSGSVYLEKGLRISLLSLGLGFNGNLTGRDNAILSCMLNGYSKRESIELLDEIKEFSELGEFFEQPVRTYSSGMKSRLGFATGVLADVDILLIDEVLSVGDKTFKQKAEKTMLEKIHGNNTVLFVSHSEQQMKRICDRIVEL